MAPVLKTLIAAAGVGACIGASVPVSRKLTTAAPTTAATLSPAALDVAILNFALNLEYLEAEFYSYAAYGKGLPECAGKSTGGAKANLSHAMQAYAEEIATDEIAHVAFLRSALGSAAVACPQLNLGSAFSGAADAATKLTLRPPFSPYFNDQTFLLGAFIFEDVGVTAYNGAATLINSKSILQAAAGILAVEAYHAAAVRTLLTQAKNFPLPPYMSASVATVANAISALRASVGGGKDAGILADRTSAVDSVPPTSIVPTDSDAIAYARTVAEVKAIVFLGSKDKGGFFPNGLNGAL